MLFIEDRIYLMSESLKRDMGEGTKIVELCEDWWELLRQEQLLFEVYVSFVYLFIYIIVSENI